MPDWLLDTNIGWVLSFIHGFIAFLQDLDWIGIWGVWRQRSKLLCLCYILQAIPEWHALLAGCSCQCWWHCPNGARLVCNNALMNGTCQVRSTKCQGLQFSNRTLWCDGQCYSFHFSVVLILWLISAERNIQNHTLCKLKVTSRPACVWTAERKHKHKHKPKHVLQMKERVLPVPSLVASLTDRAVFFSAVFMWYCVS